MKKFYTTDIETIVNFFCVVFKELREENYVEFQIGGGLNQLKELQEFMETKVRGLIGYNIIDFDYPVLHFITHLPPNTPEVSAYSRIYECSQETIDKKFSAVYAESQLFPLRDPFKIWHYDNKKVALKNLQARMDWYLVEEMSVPHYKPITNPEDELRVKSYCKNDVRSTEHFYLEHTLPLIELRRTLSNKYNLDLYNANDPKMGAEILLLRVSEAMGKSKKEVRKMRTRYSTINLRDCILPIVNFKTDKFKNLLRQFITKTIRGDQTKDAFKFLIPYDGMMYEYGTGGLHAARQTTMWQTNENITIESIDVKSYYPNLAIKHGIKPNHLGEAFAKVYNEIYQERTQYKKGTPENYGLKIALNGAFGKMNDQYSYLYDPKALLMITINGQLLLTMLCERLTMANFTVVMVNTDGIEVLVEKDRREEFIQICERWERYTALELEYDCYKYLFIRDVNNYIAQFNNGKIKTNGAYAIEKPFDKDNSMRVVRNAVKQYFIDRIPVMESIKSCTNIFYFCMSKRVFGEDEVFLNWIDPERGELLNRELPETVRMFAAVSGTPNAGYITKHMSEKRVNKIYANQRVSIYNHAVDISPEQIAQWVDYQFYYREAMKLIRGIENNQLTIS